METDKQKSYVSQDTEDAGVFHSRAKAFKAANEKLRKKINAAQQRLTKLKDTRKKLNKVKNTCR